MLRPPRRAWPAAHVTDLPETRRRPVGRQAADLVGFGPSSSHSGGPPTTDSPAARCRVRHTTVTWLAAVAAVVLLGHETTLLWPICALGAVHSVWNYCRDLSRADLSAALAGAMTASLVAVCVVTVLLTFAA